MAVVAMLSMSPAEICASSAWTVTKIVHLLAWHCWSVLIYMDIGMHKVYGTHFVRQYRKRYNDCMFGYICAAFRGIAVAVL